MEKSNFLLNELNVQNFQELKEFYNLNSFYSCDFNLVNSIVFSKKYKTKYLIDDKILYRIQFSSLKNRNGFLFPLIFDLNSENLLKSINFIADYSKKSNVEPNFVLIDEKQKELIDESLKKQNKFRIDWNTDEGDSDYIYLREKLVKLSGKKLQKKKNHINQFYKKYPESVDFEFIDSQNFTENHKNQIYKIYSDWKNAHLLNFEEDLENEENALSLSLENFKIFNLKAGILFIQQNPVAFSIGNEFSDDIFDVIFEKSLQEYAKDGSYAVINQKFAEKLTCKFINREEDLNIPGLRKAKLSYNPEKIYKKYYGKIEIL